MTVNETGPTEGFSGNLSHPSCNHDLSCWEQTMDKMYTYFYLLLFVPGLFLNTTALWVLCKHFSKKTKAVIFMINLALADLVHVLSLPLRIYYYFTHSWPFGKGICLLCFYLKYLNMYAAIFFLVCISLQRYRFLLKPFTARRWRRRYDLLISVAVWVFVAVGCLPFILMRSSESGNTNESLPHHSSTPAKPLSMAMCELFGFLLPLVCISYCSIRIAWSLNHSQPQDRSEKRRALRMVLSCSALFLLCFAPYHINFVLYLMVSQRYVVRCATVLAVKQFHPISLCLASMSCCLNPLLYYFLNAEFRMHLRRTSSFTNSILSSLSSPRDCPTQAKLLRMENR
uniref:G-protein coupled receptors family 1 profile domain-containing protein n=1 Tax=Xiphophorus couchianus TaxID=32473 RepID=A0A3B5LWW3_9TELE